VSQVYVTGGSAQSEMILQMLHTELIVDFAKRGIQRASFCNWPLPGQQAVEIETYWTQLSVAMAPRWRLFERN